ncbi:MAG: phosphodiester glycosidase family protein [Saprospiraceae bacterium]|nr:phosphodiester glycosidase family protein [Lewinella sp.]
MTRQTILGIFFPISICLLSACASYRSTATSKLFQQIYYRNIQTRSFFDSPQKIAVVSISDSDKLKGTWGMAYRRDTLIKTSEFASNEQQADVAINGGFFDMQKGGSVTYLEVDDTVINYTIDEKERWAKASPIVNGALIINKNNRIEIEPNRKAAHYQSSRREKAVFVTGPLLLHRGKRTPLGSTDFIHKRHPRSCVCVTTDQTTLLIAVDGRQDDAAGMSLPELQEYLLLNKCRDAINLDGGGSTTLWIKEQGIVNSPSDKTGERPVANVLYFRQ